MFTVLNLLQDNTLYKIITKENKYFLDFHFQKIQSQKESYFYLYSYIDIQLTSKLINTI